MDEELAKALEVVRARLAGTDSGPRVSTEELWNEWDGVAIRGDWPKCRAHRKALLETPIKLDGELTTLGALQWHRCDLRAADAWRTVMRSKLNKHGRRYAAGTRNSMLTSLRSMFRWHVKRGRIPRHPLTGLAPEPENEREGFYSHAQAEKMADALPCPYRLIFLLSLRCGGLRNAEARELRKSEIDHEARAIVIPAWRHKNRKAKTVPVTDDLWPELKEQIARSKTDFVFPSERVPDRPISPSGWQWQMERARERCGFLLAGERPCLHHARHTFSIDMLGKGAATANIMTVMGHTSLRAARRYQRLVGPALEHMRELMNERRGPRGTEPELQQEKSSRNR